MESAKSASLFLCVLLIILVVEDSGESMTVVEKNELREQVVEMFNHGYNSYLHHAYPADELMPLSCKGRYRGTEASRGDVDDILGNFSLTIIDSLDSLALLGQLDEFEEAVRLVIHNTQFDNDVIVSVFETNIRILGGLLGSHVIAVYLKKKKKGMDWYNNELLNMATEVGTRLLPAFNTSTGIPYPRINLKHGVNADISSKHRDTCTACAGTMILEFAALSRLTGDRIFEDKAHRAMDYLWQQRHRASDLVGTVINIHNGDWVRRESGVGAGIDSYYEYVLKAYILLGDNTYLERFNKHYEAVMKYISQGPMLVDVHMHKPESNSRNFMDSLLAFWPGLQVLKGDIKPAIETHEMLYQVIKRHNFLPEAFTTDFRVHWGQHPLRPEFVESTYFLYKATGDPYYLEVGKKVVKNLNKHARVPCGFASIRDVTIGNHEDQMDSFVLAETFKYLYLLFAEDDDVILNLDDYIFTTEAHILPLTLSVYNSSQQEIKVRREVYHKLEKNENEGEEEKDFLSVDKENKQPVAHHDTCPNIRYLHKSEPNYAHTVRQQLKDLVEKFSPRPKSDRPKLRAVDFIAGNKEQLEILSRMGIRLMTMSDGRIQLLHTASEAASPEDAEDGMKFMQGMIELSKNQQNEAQHEPLMVQLLSLPHSGSVVLSAGPAQFGHNLKTASPVQGTLMIADPYKACSTLVNTEHVKGHIAILERGDCMFIDKATHLQQAGALGGIVIDHNVGTSSKTSPLFAMSGDGQRDVNIPMVFLFYEEGEQLLHALDENPELEVSLAVDPRHTVSQLKEKDVSKPPKNGQHSKTLQNSQPLQEPHKLMPSANDHEGSGKPEQNIETTKIQTPAESIPASVDSNDNDVIQLELLSDGSKRLVFKFNLLLQSAVPDTKPKLNQMYVDLVSILQKQTNFGQLDNQEEYLRAMARFLEMAYFGTGSLDREAKTLLDNLAQELQILKVSDAPEGQEADEGELSTVSTAVKHMNLGDTQETKNNEICEGGHYASTEELEQTDSKQSKNPWIKFIPQDKSSKEKGVYFDKNGVMLVPVDDETILKVTKDYNKHGSDSEFLDSFYSNLQTQQEVMEHMTSGPLSSLHQTENTQMTQENSHSRDLINEDVQSEHPELTDVENDLVIVAGSTQDEQEETTDKNAGKEKDEL